MLLGNRVRVRKVTYLSSVSVEHGMVLYPKYKQNRKYARSCNLYMVLVVSAKPLPL